MTSDRDRGRLLVIASSVIALCFVFRTELERDPVLHVLVQFPALALAGWLVGKAIRGRLRAFDRLNDGGATGTLTALFTVAFWMLPRSLDAALDEASTEALKFISLPLLLGAPLALSWHKVHPLARAFLKANAVSMLAVLAFLYTHAPVRICNNYLESDQERLGIGFLFTAILAAAIWSLPLFFRPAAAPEASCAPMAVGRRT